MLWLPFLALSAFALLAVIAILANSQAAKRRTASWRQVAQELGISFLGDDDATPARLAAMKTFSRGRGRCLDNVIAGDSGDMRITLGDYRYTTGSGKNRTTHRETVCILEAQELDLPTCFLRPQIRFFDAIGALLGGQDIDFDDDAAFSNAYVLQGDDEQAVRARFTPDIRAWFAQRRSNRYQFEARGDALVFHTGRLRKPEEARQILQEALEIKSLLTPGGPA